MGIRFRLKTDSNLILTTTDGVDIYDPQAVIYGCRKKNYYYWNPETKKTDQNYWPVDLSIEHNIQSVRNALSNPNSTFAYFSSEEAVVKYLKK